MAKIRAVLLDLDGTVRDTVEAIYESIEHSFHQLGATPPTREAMQPYAHYHDHIRAEFLPDVSPQDFEQIYIKHGDETVLHAPLYDGAEETIRTLGQRGYKLAIVSSGGDIEGYLRVTNLSEEFEAVVGSKDVVHKKPHPEPVETALKRIGVRQDEAVMIGDLPADIEAAKAAGVALTIGVTYGMGSKESLIAAGADYTADSINEIVGIIEKENAQ